MIFRTCDYCGAHLDPGEACGCREEAATPEEHRCGTETVPHMDNTYNTKKEEVTNVTGKKH